MNNTFLFLFFLGLLILFQFFKYTQLTSFQFYEVLIGSLFIIVFFGLFAAMLTLNPDMIEYSIIFSTYFIIWYYMTKKITNLINMDKNGVIYYN